MAHSYDFFTYQIPGIFQVTDQSVRILAENCPELKTISLANCNITDTGICSIYKVCNILEG